MPSFFLLSLTFCWICDIIYISNEREIKAMDFKSIDILSLSKGRGLSSGAARTVYDFLNQYVIKIPQVDLTSDWRIGEIDVTCDHCPKLQYYHQNRGCNIDFPCSGCNYRRNDLSEDYGSSFYYISQSLSEIYVYENCPEEYKDLLCPIITHWFTDFQVPITVMKKVEVIDDYDDKLIRFIEEMSYEELQKNGCCGIYKLARFHGYSIEDARILVDRIEKLEDEHPNFCSSDIIDHISNLGYDEQTGKIVIVDYANLGMDEDNLFKMFNIETECNEYNYFEQKAG